MGLPYVKANCGKDHLKNTLCDAIEYSMRLEDSTAVILQNGGRFSVRRGVNWKKIPKSEEKYNCMIWIKKGTELEENITRKIERTLIKEGDELECP